MSSFFTIPSAQKKRKRTEVNGNSTSKRRSTIPPKRKAQTITKDARLITRDASISGSDSEASDGNSEDPLADKDDSDVSDSEDDNETAAEKRLRIAERYLQSLKEETAPNGDEFDAAEIDRDRIAERLREDVAVSKGKLYRHIASQFAFSTAWHTAFRSDQYCPNGIAVAGDYVYMIAKDITLSKWELAPAPDPGQPTRTNFTPRRKPRLIKTFKGFVSRSKDPKYSGHTASILCVAVSSSGKYVATGGSDKRLVIWDAASLKPIKTFTQHRDAVLSLSFRRNTHTLYSASADRTIKIWSLDEMMYIETLFGHQDQIVDLVGLSQEVCISVGSRDRTARLWKVVEESQLVFRGGGIGATKDMDGNEIGYAEGSIERVAMIDDDLFVTGSDNGSISLWNVHRKKPINSISLAHGCDPLPRPEEISADTNPQGKADGRPQPRWITALATIPYSDLIVSGSWDGYIRIWRVSEDKRQLESVGAVSSAPSFSAARQSVPVHLNGVDGQRAPAQGIINDISVFERGDRGKDGLSILAVVSKEHRLGQWKKVRAKNGAILFEVTKSTVSGQNPPHGALPPGH